MSHVVNYGGQYFRVELTEVVIPGDSDKTVYVGWCSEAFKELKDMPKQALSRFIAGPGLPTYAAALQHAQDWIKAQWDAQPAKRSPPAPKGRDSVSVLYTVWLFKGDGSTGFEFEEFTDATAFAKAAEKSLSLTKVGTTNNESPQYLTVWERA
jgi:hypothetical protein